MKRSERITAVLTSLAGLVIMVYAWKVLRLGTIHTPDTGLLPFLCGGGLAILGVLWLVTLRGKEDRKGVERAQKGMRYRPFASLALMILYAWAMETLGYITSTLLFMVAWQQVIEREKWMKTIVITVLATVGMYSLFRLFLRVPIPQELFLR
jgi:putative tricarboxylic transport membrane protein